MMNETKYNMYANLDKLPGYIPTTDLKGLFERCISSNSDTYDKILLKNFDSDMSVGNCHDYIQRLHSIPDKNNLTQNLTEYLLDHNANTIFYIMDRDTKKPVITNEINAAYNFYKELPKNSDKSLFIRHDGTLYPMISEEKLIDITNYPLFLNHTSLNPVYQAINKSFSDLKEVVENDHKTDFTVKSVPKYKKDRTKMLFESLNQDAIVNDPQDIEL